MSIFSSIPVFKPKTNKINLSHQNIMTSSFGRLAPCLCEEVLPGDVFKVQTELFLRFQPLLSPIMDQCDVSIHYYMFPSRLGFENIYKFFVDEEIVPGWPAVIPFSHLDDIVIATAYAQFGGQSMQIPWGTYKVDKSLMDYLNLPTTQFTVTSDENGVRCDAPHIPVNIIPFIGYYLIWSKYYRDENLDDNNEMMQRLKSYIRDGGDLSFTYPEGDWDLLVELCRIRNRAYKKDYFTSALPWPQKGDDVLVPLASQDVEFYGPSAGNLHLVATETGRDGTKLYDSNTDGGAVDPLQLQEIKARTQGNNSMTINDLRTSMRVQQLLENNARGGTRQQEFIKAHWGVYAKDSRINDPEYIGGSTSPISISEVLSQVADTAPGTDGSNLGQLGGRGVSVGFSSTKKYRVTEHGYLFAILSIRPKASYFQGIPRMFSHLERYQFFFPELSHLGEQEILNKELVVEPQDPGEERSDPDGTFGYTPRYAEYKYHGNEIHGDFRDTLKFWHTARIFEFMPGLNKDFVSVNSDDQGQNRIFNYVNGDYDQILIQLYHHNSMLRKMPYYGIPKF